jgi:serine protease Do
MKRILFTAALLAFIGFPGFLWAQEDVIKDKETEEIVIRKKGDSKTNVTVEINGDNIIVNGKPLAEFKDDQITIKKRKMIIRDGDNAMAFDFGPGMKGFKWDGNIPDEKEMKRPFLGVTTEKADDGAKIVDIVKESAAEKAGLKVDDIITKVENEKVTDPNSLSKIVGEKNPGDQVKITYKRNGKTRSEKIKLGERIEKKSMAFSFSGPDGMMRSFKMPKIEMFKDNIPMPPLPDMDDDSDNRFNWFDKPRHQKLGLKIQDTEEGGNVKVIDVEEESAAEKAGLKKDDIITEINGNKVNNTDDARMQLKPEEGKSAYNIKALRNGKEQMIEVKIPKKLKTANL